MLTFSERPPPNIAETTTTKVGTARGQLGGHCVHSGFWSGFEELEKDWQAESKRDKCEGPVDNTDAACKLAFRWILHVSSFSRKLSTCTFGTAFDGVEGRYSKDVTDFATDFTKFVTGAVFEAFIPGELPQS